MGAGFKDLSGLKEKDLAPCAACGKHHEAPVFYKVMLEHYAFDMAAIQRQIGLGMMLGGNAAIAQAMGPDEDMAKRLSGSSAIICLDCASRLPVLALMDGDDG